MLIHVQCKQCGKWVQIADPLRDVDESLDCDCCPLPHNHGAAARACPGHDGPCGVGVAGCTVCRPVTVTYLSGVIVR